MKYPLTSKHKLLQEIVKTIFDFAGLPHEEKILDACILDVKRSIDRDYDDCITKEEFVKNARLVLVIQANYLVKMACLDGVNSSKTCFSKARNHDIAWLPQKIQRQ